MDVFVLVEDGKVLGAGQDLECAMEIADRNGETDWEVWHPFTDSWVRRRDPYGNSYRITQQIVRVPLAGYGRTPTPTSSAPAAVFRSEAPWSDQAHDVVSDVRTCRSEIEEIGRTWGAP